jgi:hypothetical protein
MAAGERSSRKLRALAQRLTRELGSERTLLNRFIATMRIPRDLPADDKPIDDSDVAELARHDDALGQLYQALNAPKLEAAYRATARLGRKFTVDEIPAATQLFTPRWVVESLLQNTLGKIWAQWHPDSRLIATWQWLIRRDDSALPARRADDLKILDPACGTMNFGIVAIEMLDAMYREEIDRAGRGGWGEPSVKQVDQIAPSIAHHNLFGIDIDPVALDLARATLDLKAGTNLGAIWNLRCADALQTPVTVRPDRFDVVVTNPPYLSSRNLNPTMVARLKHHFPASWRDYYACFIERSIELLAPNGLLGILAMHSFMFTAGFERLRRQLAEHVAIESIAHFGPGLFDVGNPGTLQTAAITMRREPDAVRRGAQPIVAIRLTKSEDKCLALREKLKQCDVHHLTQRDLFAGSPRLAWSYWLSPADRRAFATFPKLAHVAPPRQGLATTDNARFVRYWWEVGPTAPDAPCVASPDTWFPYVKSGRFCRWFESPRHRVNWRDDGRQIKAAIVQRYPYLKGQWQWVAKNSRYYFRAGVTYSYLTSGRFSARLMEAGAIFDVAGSAIFPEGDSLGLLGVLNSSVARRLLEAINPTVNFQVGDLGELPLPPAISRSGSLRDDVARAVELMRCVDAWDETSPAFVAPLPWRDAEERLHSLRRELRAVERRIELEVAELYGMSVEQCHDSGLRFDRAELARRWVSHALRGLVRERRGRPIRIIPLEPRLLRELGERLDCTEAIDAAVEGIGKFLMSGFVAWHGKLYRRRPVIWALGSKHRAHVISHDFATRDAIASVLPEGALPVAWRREVDDGIAVDLAPLADHLLDPALRKALRDHFAATAVGVGVAAAAAAASPSGLAGLPPSGRRTVASCAPIV